MRTYTVKGKLWNTRLEAKSWKEVPSELFDKGYVNMGEVEVVESVYEKMSVNTRTIDTSYGG